MKGRNMLIDSVEKVQYCFSANNKQTHRRLDPMFTFLLSLSLYHTLSANFEKDEHLISGTVF